MSNIAIVTTFPTNSWDIYSKRSVQAFAKFLPADVPMLVQLDDDLLAGDVSAVLNREGDAIAVGWGKEHREFVERNKGRDDPQNYRMQAVRFCHKVFSIARAYDSIENLKKDGEPSPRYLIWIDADVILTRPITIDEITECLPKEGDAVSYLGRKDWDHSECGWLAFDLENGGDKIIKFILKIYLSDKVFDFDQWHDSWIWDKVFNNVGEPKNKLTNLTPDAKGMDVWSQSPMSKWSTHYKGPEAKAKLAMEKKPVKNPNQTSNVIIQTKNAIPHEKIREHIVKNQSLIKNWVKPCKGHDEEIVVASAGPMLVAEDLRVEAGKKIVAVKHALVPLKKAGITPWACILLDPRPHVADFIQDADPSIIWFVASQVNPQVTLELLAKGCTVWGYHASVNAGEESLTALQESSIVAGGSATATRGLYLLNHLGFSKFKLYGYDLCVPDKPDMEAKDDYGQPKYFEMSIGMNDPMYNVKKLFWSEPQLIAQFEEINELIKQNKFHITAVGDGIVPFMLKAKRVSEMRRAEVLDKLVGINPPYYMDMLQ